jgi:predicted metal-dependent peptidase
MDSLEDQGKGLSEEEKKQIKNEIRESLMASAQASAGNLPVGVERLVSSLTQPKLSWKELLRQDIQSSIKFDYTFSRPAKKGMQNGVVLPGMKREDALDLCVAIDCSGSISQDDLRAFLSEIQGIMSQYDEYVIRVWSFDTKVYNDETFRSDEGADITTYKAKGGGGTLFECNWEHMRENDINPKIFIMFTDMYPCGGWGEESYCENTIFVAYKTKDKVAPYGTTICMD